MCVNERELGIESGRERELTHTIYHSYTSLKLANRMMNFATSSLVAITLFQILYAVPPTFPDEGKRCGLSYRCGKTTTCVTNVPGFAKSGYCRKRFNFLATEISCSDRVACPSGHECRPFGLGQQLVCVSNSKLVREGQSCTKIDNVHDCSKGLKCMTSSKFSVDGRCVLMSSQSKLKE